MTASDQDVFAYDDSRDQVAAQDGRMPLMLGYAAYTQQLRYGSMLKSIWQGDKLYNPSYALATDPDAYEVCMRYSVFRQCVDARLRKVSMRQWSIQPGDESEAAKRLAGVVEDWMNRISRFTEVKYQLANAAIIGETYGYLCGKRRMAALDNCIGNWWMVDRVDDIDPRRFFWKIMQDPATGRRFAKLTMWRIGKNPDSHIDADSPDNWIPLPDHLPMVRVVYNDAEQRLGRGRGLLEAGYQEVWIVQEIRTLINEAVGTAARGVILAKIDTLASGSQSTAARRTAWLDFLAEIQRNNRGVYDKRDEVELHPGWDSGVDRALQVQKQCDDNIRSLLLGSSLPFGGSGGGGSGGGSLARASEEGDQSDEIIDYDCAKLDDDITRDFIGAFLRYNRAPLRAHGLNGAKPPRFESAKQKKHNPQERVETATKLLAMGKRVRIDLAELMEMCGFTQPQDGAVTVDGKDQPEPGQGMPPGAGGPDGGDGGGGPLAELLGGAGGGDRDGNGGDSDKGVVGKESRNGQFAANKEKPGEHWVTIGGAGGEDGGGTPVLLDGDGNIVKGPRNLTGASVNDIGRKGQAAEHRKAADLLAEQDDKPGQRRRENNPQNSVASVASVASITGDGGKAAKEGEGKQEGGKMARKLDSDNAQWTQTASGEKVIRLSAKDPVKLFKLVPKMGEVVDLGGTEFTVGYSGNPFNFGKLKALYLYAYKPKEAKLSDSDAVARKHLEDRLRAEEYDLGGTEPESRGGERPA